MVAASELERNLKLQLFHPYTFQWPDQVPKPPEVYREEFLRGERATPAQDVGYESWSSVEVPIDTSWREVVLDREFDLVLIESDVDILFRGLGRRSSGVRLLLAGRIYTASVKTWHVFLRTVTGTGRVWVDGLAS